MQASSKHIEYPVPWNKGIIMQRKTKNPVQFEITEQTRAAVHTLIVKNRRKHRITCSVVFTPLHIIFRHASMQSY